MIAMAGPSLVMSWTLRSVRGGRRIQPPAVRAARAALAALGAAAAATAAAAAADRGGGGGGPPRIKTVKVSEAGAVLAAGLAARPWLLTREMGYCSILGKTITVNTSRNVGYNSSL